MTNFIRSSVAQLFANDAGAWALAHRYVDRKLLMLQHDFGSNQCDTSVYRSSPFSQREIVL